MRLMLPTIAVAAVLSAGCSHTELTAPLPSDRSANAATLTIHRGQLSPAATLFVSLDGKMLGSVGASQSISMTVPPGKHTLSTWTADTNPASLTVNLDPRGDECVYIADSWPSPETRERVLIHPIGC